MMMDRNAHDAWDRTGRGGALEATRNKTRAFEHMTCYTIRGLGLVFIQG
jgi:hypothetical protein